MLYLHWPEIQGFDRPNGAHLVERSLLLEERKRPESVPEVGATPEALTKDVSQTLTWALQAKLLRRITRENGLRYEVTASGWRFLEEYKKIRRGTAEAKPSFSSDRSWLLELGADPLRLQQLYEVMKPTITIVIPTMNEADNVSEVLKDIRKQLDHSARVLIIDGGDDQTSSIASRFGAVVLRQVGKGKGSALLQAFDAVESEIIVTMDGDRSMMAQEIRGLIDTIISGAEVAKGSRFISGGGSEDISGIRTIGNSLFLSLVNFIWRSGYTDLCYGFMALRKDALERLRPHLRSKHFEIETEILIKAKKLRMETIEIPSFEHRRQHGISKLSGFRDSVRILATILLETLRA